MAEYSNGYDPDWMLRAAAIDLDKLHPDVRAGIEAEMERQKLLGAEILHWTKLRQAEEASTTASAA